MPLRILVSTAGTVDDFRVCPTNWSRFRLARDQSDAGGRGR